MLPRLIEKLPRLRFVDRFCRQTSLKNKVLPSVNGLPEGFSALELRAWIAYIFLHHLSHHLVTRSLTPMKGVAQNTWVVEALTRSALRSLRAYFTNAIRCVALKAVMLLGCFWISLITLNCRVVQDLILESRI
jgi:hypothetical protein